MGKSSPEAFIAGPSQAAAAVAASKSSVFRCLPDNRREPGCLPHHTTATQRARRKPREPICPRLPFAFLGLVWCRGAGHSRGQTHVEEQQATPYIEEKQQSVLGCLIQESNSIVKDILSTEAFARKRRFVVVRGCFNLGKTE